ncbi:MAG: putative Ig domain-containing protein, partial [Gammaproteobacteria bacterium]|nr:putative Ig domain-containing protein [Gammaproteobacteria bacterium]
DVTAQNDLPTAANVIPDQNATEDSPFRFQFASNAFNDTDVGDTLSYTAVLADDSALPAWLSFDDSTRTFSGTPMNGDVGTISIKVTADDGKGGTATDTFDLTVRNSNDLPLGLPRIAGTPVLNQILTADSSLIQDLDDVGVFSYQWLRDGVPINGATNNTYLLSAADVGFKISVEVHYTDGGGTAETVTSAQTAVVAGLEGLDNSPQVVDLNSDNAISNDADALAESVDEAAEKDPSVETKTDRKQTGESLAPDFDFAAMAREIQPINASEIAGIFSDQGQHRPITDRAMAVDKVIQPKWIDLKHLDIKTFAAEGLEQIEVVSVMDNADFLHGLDLVNRELDEAAKNTDAHYKLGTEAAVGVTLSLSAGFVSWLLRSGSLIASFMSVVPMWKQLDPLPILGAAIVKGKKIVGVKDGKANEDKAVEDIFDQDESR